jgi:3-hydroxyacyl-CoA dehydrogenase
MPGFIANRLLMPYINEAIQALQEVYVAFALHFRHSLVI